MVKYPSEADIEGLGGCLAEAAYETWIEGGLPESDFCVQAIGTCAVFGGCNRMQWSPTQGFRLFVSHSLPERIDKWKEVYGENSTM